MRETTWEQTRARRLTLEAVMVLLLVAVLGVSMLVTRVRLSADRIDLGDPMVDGPVSLRLPRTWSIAHEFDDTTGRFIHAAEPGPDGRTISVFRHRPDRLLSPVEYLAESGILIERNETTDVVASPGRAVGGWTPTEIGGFPAVLYRISYPGDAPDAQAIGARAPVRWPKRLIGLTVLPSHQAIAIRVEGTGPVDLADERLIREILASVQFIDDKPARVGDGGEIVTLRPPASLSTSVTTTQPLDPVAWSTLRVPAGFAVAPERGHGSSDVTLMGVPTALQPPPNGRDRDPQSSWEMIELVPVLIHPDTDADGAKMILATRSLVWAAGKVTDESPVSGGRRVWRVDPPGKDFDFAGARRAYVLAEPDGHGLAIILHLPRESVARLDSLWSAILPTVQFQPSPDPKTWLRNGELEVARHRNSPAVPLAPTTWWSHADSVGRELGWLRERTSPNAKQGTTRLRSRTWNGTLLEIDTHWTTDITTRTSDDVPRTGDDVSRTGDNTSRKSENTPRTKDGSTTRVVRERTRAKLPTSTDAADVPIESTQSSDDPDEVLRQTVLVSNSVLRTTLLGTLVANTEESAPGDFVWQHDLPDLLSRASRFPMSIQTDALGGADRRLVPGLLRLIVRADTSADDNIVLHVEPVGSGQAQRWTFDRPTRTLTELRLADGSKLSPSSEIDIRLRFQNIPTLLP